MSSYGQLQKRGMAKDTILYMIAKAVEGVAGVVTFSLYSYFFEKTMYGYYSTLNIAVTTLAMISIQWLSQSSYRYLNDFETDAQQHVFYSTSFFLWLVINVSFVTLGSMALLSVHYFAKDIAVLSKFLSHYSYIWLALGILFFVSYNSSQLMTALLAAKRETKLNLFLSVFSVVGKLLSVTALVKLLGSRIEWIFLCGFLFDGAVSVIAAIKLNFFPYLSLKHFSKPVLNRFLIYGFPLVGNIVTTMILNNSDRYIISYYAGFSEVGVYTMNYSIISSAFTMISIALMRGTYPTILKAWSEKKYDVSKELISHAVRNYLLISIPAVAGVFALSRTVAVVLLAEQYQEGYMVMSFVALALMFNGLTEYANKPWELQSNTKIILRNSFIGGLVNIVLNIIFIPRFGYMTAAVTTFIGFLVFFLFSKCGSVKYIKWAITPKTYVKIVVSALMMAITLSGIVAYAKPSVFMLGASVIIGIFIYFLCLYLLGEIRNEANFVLNKIKERFVK